MPLRHRIEWVDLAKGGAILCVMLSHMYGGVIHKCLFSFEIPLFFFLSGYCLNLEKSTVHIAVSRLKQLMIPFAAVSLIIFTVRCYELFLAEQLSFYSALSCAQGILEGSPRPKTSVGPFWFLPALWFATVMVRILLRSKRSLVYICALAMLGNLSLKWVQLPMSIQLGFSCAPYLYLGCMSRRWKLADISELRDIVFVLFLCAFWAYCVYAYGVSSSVPRSLGSALAAILAIFFSVALCQLLVKLKWVKIAFQYLGMHTLLVLSIHCLDETLGLYQRLGIFYSPLLRICLTCLIAIVIAFLMKYVEDKRKRTC